MADEKKAVSKHIVTIDRREALSVTGVLDVVSFDEETIVAETELGILILKGNNLHVNKLNLENGDLQIDGDICSLTYEEQTSFAKSKGSLLGKLFK